MAVLDDARAGYPRLRASRARAASHPIEKIGREIRALRQPLDEKK